MANEEKINFNNGDSVVKKVQKETFPEEITRLQINESVTGEVTIKDENIKNNSKFIVNLFDES